MAKRRIKKRKSKKFNRGAHEAFMVRKGYKKEYVKQMSDAYLKNTVPLLKKL